MILKPGAGSETIKVNFEEANEGINCIPDSLVWKKPHVNFNPNIPIASWKTIKDQKGTPLLLHYLSDSYFISNYDTKIKSSPSEDLEITSPYQGKTHPVEINSGRHWIVRPHTLLSWQAGLYLDYAFMLNWEEAKKARGAGGDTTKKRANDTPGIVGIKTRRDVKDEEEQGHGWGGKVKSALTTPLELGRSSYESFQSLVEKYNPIQAWGNVAVGLPIVFLTLSPNPKDGSQRNAEKYPDPKWFSFHYPGRISIIDINGKMTFDPTRILGFEKGIKLDFEEFDIKTLLHERELYHVTLEGEGKVAYTSLPFEDLIDFVKGKTQTIVDWLGYKR